ncbi:MAG: hypothetical protein HC880_01250 [Bacteroidia bacterium]|nr:hypothetical protein [Bacteroidia bacterium]
MGVSKGVEHGSKVFFLPKPKRLNKPGAGGQARGKTRSSVTVLVPPLPDPLPTSLAFGTSSRPTPAISIGGSRQAGISHRVGGAFGRRLVPPKAPHPPPAAAPGWLAGIQPASQSGLKLLQKPTPLVEVNLKKQVRKFILLLINARNYGKSQNLVVSLLPVFFKKPWGWF